MDPEFAASPAGESEEAFAEAAVLEPCDPEGDASSPLVRIREEHNISRRDIDPDALKVLYRLSRNQYTAYLVGGGVRDLLLGRRPKDFDISTNARPEEIRALFRNCILIGRRFRLAHIRYGEKIIETSTFRRTPESSADPADPDADLFQRDDNLFGTPQEDALRRDFTVNGLFYDIESFSIIDYVGGMEDLTERRIRSIGDPCIRFREDPVRMIRAVRFASRLNFELDPDTRDAIVRHGDELAKAAPARLLEEITRLFAFASGEKSVRLLQSTGLLKVILPEVAEALDSDRVDTDLFWRRLRTLDKGDTVLPDATPALIFSTLLLDPLKQKLGRDWQSDDFPRLKFDKVHAFLEPLALRLRFPRKLVDRIVHLYLAQHRFAHTGGKRGSIANFVTQDSFHEALALAEIVHAAAGKPSTGLNYWRDMLAERIYGKEEGRSDHDKRRAHVAPPPAPEHVGNGDGDGSDNLEAVHLDEPQQGKRLSRSARRRRNKKLRRQRLESQERETATAEEAQPDMRVIVHPVPPEPKRESETPPAAPAEKGKAAEAETAKEKGKKASTSKSRRERTKKKSAKAEETKPAAETKPAPHVEAAIEAEPFQPLTAAAFYLTPLEPEPEPEPAKKKKAAGKARATKKAKKAEEAKPAANESARLKPPAMDKADEADIPMHWLDEI